jgi:peroxiredoxin
MTLRRGDLAPDFTLPTLDSDLFMLSYVLKKHAVLLVFLRHLG